VGTGRLAAAAAAFAVGLLLSEPAAGLPREEAILSAKDHPSAETRALAEAHADELLGLYEDVRRCAPRLDFQRHGIAFQRPRGAAAAAPHLTLWVWLDPGRPPRGPDLVARAAEAFRRHGQGLFRRLMARTPVFVDPRAGGYGLILTWLKPEPVGGRLVGESLALFADKLTVANFVHDTIAATTFLTRVEVRAFDGQTEVRLPRLAVEDDDGAAAPREAC